MTNIGNDGGLDFFAKELADHEFLLFPHAYIVIERFAWNGEPLCKKIMEMFEKEDYPAGWGHVPFGYRKVIMHFTDIAEKLLTRKMSELEYRAYLEGEKPIGSFNGREYFLTKSEKCVA